MRSEARRWTIRRSTRPGTNMRWFEGAQVGAFDSSRTDQIGVREDSVTLADIEAVAAKLYAARIAEADPYDNTVFAWDEMPECGRASWRQEAAALLEAVFRS